jgi:hypothetical protein
MAMTLDGSLGVTFNDASLQPAAASPYGLKNKIINGDMRIDQRNAGASVTPVNAANTYTLDRWASYVNQASKLTAQQSTVAPTGFTNSLKVTSSSAYSVVSGDIFSLQQAIEGLNVSDLAWGTANAKTVTLSFQVYSSLTGTFGGVLQNSAQNRSYPFTYTVSSANTWTTVSVTIAGDTSGTWLTTNGIGMYVLFGLGVGTTYSGTAGAWAGATYFSATGATSVVGTSGATWYITGVQLEVGSTATPFERRMYGTELALCQRYYTKFGAGYAYTSYGSGYASSATQSIVHISYPTAMRTQPTSSLSGSNRLVFSGGSVVVSGFNLGATGILDGYFTFTSSGMTTNLPCIVGPNGDSTAYLDLSAEL